ncbi:MAG: hypothetical protein R3Y32_01755 [Bacillota bacterium]
MTIEVELLLKIWKTLDEESQEQLKGDFTQIKEKLMCLGVEDNLSCDCVVDSREIAGVEVDNQQADRLSSHEYLRGLSNECLEMFFQVLADDGLNLYHSAMAWCQSHRSIKSPTELYECYKRKYKSKRQYVIDYEEELIELFDHCIEKYLGKRGDSFFVATTEKNMEYAMEDNVEEVDIKAIEPPPEEHAVCKESLGGVAYEKFEYNGEIYYYHNNEFLDSSFIILSGENTAKVANAYFKNINYKDMTVQSQLDLLKKLKKAKQFGTAIKVAEVIFEENSRSKGVVKMVLPIVMSIYRELGKPQMAIEFADQYLSVLDCGSQALYTSLAAAYCDIENFKQAKSAALKGEEYRSKTKSAFCELDLVWSRIDKETK